MNDWGVSDRDLRRLQRPGFYWSLNLWAWPLLGLLMLKCVVGWMSAVSTLSYVMESQDRTLLDVVYFDPELVPGESYSTVDVQEMQNAIHARYMLGASFLATLMIALSLLLLVTATRAKRTSVKLYRRLFEMGHFDPPHDSAPPDSATG